MATLHTDRLVSSPCMESIFICGDIWYKNLLFKTLVKCSNILTYSDQIVIAYSCHTNGTIKIKTKVFYTL